MDKSIKGKEREALFTMVQLERGAKKKAKLQALKKEMSMRDYLAFLIEQDSNNANA